MHGVEETRARLKNPDLINRPIRKFWTSASVVAIGALQRFAPRAANHRGGNRPLWASHISEIDPADPALGMTIRNVAPYHKYVVEGTRPHVIRPRYAKALFWAGAKHPYAIVHHPGTRANDYMQRAFASVRSIITNGEPSQTLHAAVRDIWERSR